MSGSGVAGESHAGALERLRDSDAGANQTLIEHVPGILYVAEAGWDGRWWYVSPQVEVLLGWTAAEWLADPGLYAGALDAEDWVEEEAEELPGEAGEGAGSDRAGGRCTREYRLTTRDGRVRWFRDDTTLVVNEGERSVWCGVLTDVTERKRSEMLLRRSVERARAVLDTATDAYVAFDGQGRVCDWNRAGEKIFGWTRGQIVGRLLVDTLTPEQVSGAGVGVVEQAMAADDTVLGRTLQLSVVCSDGEELPVELTLWRTWEDDVVRYSAFLRDITDRKTLEAQLRRHAYRDALTGLANRTLFQHRVAQHLAAPKRGGCAVLVLGVDDFRSVNDSLGHAAADELLEAVADRLRPHVWASDTFARLSGDEFALLLVDVKAPADALRLAERFHDLLRSSTSPAGGPTVRVSVGVRHSAAGTDIGAAELLSDAGAAMFTATRSGRGVAFFENQMRADRIRRLQLTEALEHAVDRGEISVHYQPYFSFTDGRACGVEALARWHHPIHGQVPPSEFIVLAESTGQIQSIGLFVLTRACRDIAALHRDHPRHRDVVLSVNISARQLLDDRLQHQLATVLAETGLPGGALMLELTETALVEDAYGAAQRLAEIRSTGVRLAVDDFGTRYASLAYLQRFPIDTLKVDRTFVTRMDHSTHEHRLTGAIIALAKTLGLRTIAEGIEEDEHALRLSDWGCDAGQGYLFARPVPLDGLLTALTSGTQRMHHRLPPDRLPTQTEPNPESESG